MKTVLGILGRDLKALLRNPIAMLVVGALLVLPGLYAWYCIYANWDPYSNTGQMPIAVVNEDKGATNDLAGEINIGKEVIDKLKDNNSIDWRIYDSKEQALEDTRLSYVYATIVFPEDLSSRIVGIIEGSTDPPLVYCYPNEKYNAVATKVSDSASQTLVRGINQQFSSKVNKTLLEKMQGAVDGVEKKAGEINTSALDEIKSANKEIDKFIASLDDASSSIAAWRVAVTGTQGVLTGVNNQLPIIEKGLSEGSDDLKKLREKTDEFNASFTQALIDSGAAITRLSGTVSADVNMACVDVSSVVGGIDAIVAQLEVIVESLPEHEKTKELREVILETLEELRNTNAEITDASDSANESVKRLNEKVKEVTSDASTTALGFTSDVMPQLSSGAGDLATAFAELSGAVTQFKPQIDELKNVLTQADSALDEALGSIANAKVLLTDVSNHLNSTVTDLGSLGSALEIDQLAELLDIDPDNLGSFVSSPVKMVTEEIYPVSNYGTAVAPFYTNLALWVGCFILISLIKLEVDRKGFEHATNTQCYFGRWLLLVILALLQSQVICGVDILLGIDCMNPALFMLAGAVCSFVYMNLLFALVITFRNIGKTLCILLVIMQVPGSSGMFPIEMMPSFFQAIHPALPFTYGIDAMREALSGMHGNNYAVDLCVLLTIVPVSLLIGLVLRPSMMNLLQLFDEEMRKTGFFASEEHGRGGDNARIRGMMRALAAHDDFRDDVEERAWAFKRRYPRLRRAGSIIAFAIPIVFILIMLVLNLVLGDAMTPDLKLRGIMFMLVVLLIVMIALIILEYAHRSVIEETKLLGVEIMGYETLFDQVEEVHQAAEQRVDEFRHAAHARIERVREDITEDMASAAPPLSDEVMAMIPAAGKASRGKHAAPSAGDASGAAADSASSESSRSNWTPPKKKHGVASDIFRTDMRLGFQSVIGVVVIMLLAITPSLYAWFNIAGSWDPYGNTGGLRVAVANSDEGYKGDLIPVNISIGDMLESQLQGNKSFDWVFTNEAEAISGVESGSYYAAIVIPSDFSKNLMTYLTDDTSYPNVKYYTNKKENPIAPIITQKGADSIQESIRTAFTQHVDEVALTVAYDLVGYITKPSVNGYALKMEGHFKDATHDMKTGSTELKSLASLSGTVSGVVSATGAALDGIAGAGETARKALGSAESGATSAGAAFQEAADLLKKLFSGSGGDIDELEAEIDAALARLQNGVALAPPALNEVAEKLGEWIEVLEIIDELFGGSGDEGSDAGGAGEGGSAADDSSDGDSSDVLESDLAPIINALKKLKTAVENAAQTAEEAPSSIATARAELAEMTDNLDGTVTEARDFYNSSVKPAVSDLKSSLSTVSDSARTILDGLESTVDGLSGSTDGLTNQLTSLSSGLTTSADKLNSLAKKLDDARQRLDDALSSGEVTKVRDVLLGSDIDYLSKHLAEPIQIEREAIYPVRNYGSSMAPFYTVLSLWVGALVLVATMRVHVVEERLEQLRRRYRKVRPRHEFFGRYGIFGFISLLQSTLVLLGDLLLFQIQCVNPIAFLLGGIFIGQVFCLFVYTLTELFGDVGKALCVILLIMQVAASGGTFPPEMLSKLLFEIVPYLPFYHAMRLLQECVAGISMTPFLIDIASLLVTVGILLLVGIVVRRPFRIVNDFLERQLEKTGYM